MELDCAVRGGEQRKVLAYTDILACKEFRSALPHDYRAGLYGLAGKHLYSPVFRIAVSAVSSRALSLFMCHSFRPLLSSKSLVSIYAGIIAEPDKFVQKNFASVHLPVYLA